MKKYKSLNNENYNYLPRREFIDSSKSFCADNMEPLYVMYNHVKNQNKDIDKAEFPEENWPGLTSEHEQKAKNAMHHKTAHLSREEELAFLQYIGGSDIKQRNPNLKIKACQPGNPNQHELKYEYHVFDDVFYQLNDGSISVMLPILGENVYLEENLKH